MAIDRADLSSRLADMFDQSAIEHGLRPQGHCFPGPIAATANLRGIPVLPVQQVDETTWLKRDDLFQPYGDTPMNGTKLLQCRSLLAGSLGDIQSQHEGTVYSENLLGSPQSPIVARVAREFGLRCIIPVGCKGMERAIAENKAPRLAREFGAEIDRLCQMPAGPVLPALANAKYGNRFFHVKFGMNAADPDQADLVLGPVAAQVEAFRGLPTETMTLVVPSGSCIVFAGLLLGLARTDIRFKRIVSLQVAGYDRSKDIRALIGDAEVPAFEHIVDETYAYSRLLHREVGGVTLDAQYEAKAWDWVLRNIPADEAVMFYIVGNSNWARDLPRRKKVGTVGPRSTVSW